MGTWAIIIEGTGPNHSAGVVASDANRLAAGMVTTLQTNGHIVRSAVFRYGGKDASSDEDIADQATYITQLNALTNPTDAAGGGVIQTDPLPTGGGEVGAG